jgi:small-conductance mechanosensitive channel
MENASWVSWLIRTGLAIVIVTGTVMLLRRLKGGRGTWRDLRHAMGAFLRRQASGVVTVAAGLLLVTILLPLAGFPAELTSTLFAVIGGLWVIVAAWSSSVATSAVVSFVQWKYDMEAEDNLRARRVHTRIRILQRILVVIIWIAALAGILMQFERFRAIGTTLLASAGVLSVILGISAQKTFGAIIAGIQVALSQPINLDDVVIVEGEWGRIEEITFTYVVVRIWDQRRLILPVTYFLETPFQNWTRQSSDILGSVFLHVDYETDLEPIRAEAQRLCESAGTLWDGKTCGVQVTEAGAEDMTIRVLVSSSNASRSWDLRCLIREGLIVYIREHCPSALPKRRLVIDQVEEGNGASS